VFRDSGDDGLEASRTPALRAAAPTSAAYPVLPRPPGP
jgi:hypothetical protein